MKHVIDKRVTLSSLLVFGVILLLWACGGPEQPTPQGETSESLPTDTVPEAESPALPEPGKLCENPALPDTGTNVIWNEEIGTEESDQIEWDGKYRQEAFKFREGEYTNERGQVFSIKVESITSDLVLEYTDSLKVCMEAFDLTLATEPKIVEEMETPTSENGSEEETYTLEDAIIISFEPSAQIVDEFKDGFNWVFLIDPKITSGKIHNYLKTRYQNGYTAVGYYNGQMGSAFCVYNTLNTPVATPSYRTIPPTAFYKYPSTPSTTYYNYRLTIWGKAGTSEYMLTGMWSYYTKYQTPPTSPPAGSIVCPTKRP